MIYRGEIPKFKFQIPRGKFLYTNSGEQISVNKFQIPNTGAGFGIWNFSIWNLPKIIWNLAMH
jgi:hypothetical protein